PLFMRLQALLHASHPRHYWRCARSRNEENGGAWKARTPREKFGYTPWGRCPSCGDLTCSTLSVGLFDAVHACRFAFELNCEHRDLRLPAKARMFFSPERRKSRKSTPIYLQV